MKFETKAAFYMVSSLPSHNALCFVKSFTVAPQLMGLRKTANKEWQSRIPCWDAQAPNDFLFLLEK